MKKTYKDVKHPQHSAVFRDVSRYFTGNNHFFQGIRCNIASTITSKSLIAYYILLSLPFFKEVTRMAAVSHLVTSLRSLLLNYMKTNVKQ